MEYIAKGGRVVVNGKPHRIKSASAVCEDGKIVINVTLEARIHSVDVDMKFVTGE